MEDGRKMFTESNDIYFPTLPKIKDHEVECFRSKVSICL